MSSQRWEKTDLPKSKSNLVPLGKTGWLPTTSQLHCFALCNLYLGAFYSMVAGDCPTVVILVQPTLPRSAQLGTAIMAACQYHVQLSTLAPARWGKTSVASKMSTTTTAWWPASHWKTMPWNVKSTIRKSRASPTQTWIAFAKLVACIWYRTGAECHWPWNVKSTMRKTWSFPTQTWIAWGKLVQLRSFTFLQCTSSVEDHFEPW